MPKSDSELYYASHNSDGQETVIFLHGLYSSSNEYAQVISFTPSRYHILIPDLPGHSKSSQIPLSSLHSVVDHVLHLISTHARNGKAHVVGLSFGGYTALTLAAEHPEVVLSCFATGASMSAQSLAFRTAPYMMACIHPLMKIPGFVTYFTPYPIPPALLADIQSNSTFSLGKQGYGALSSEFRRSPISVRTMLCSGSASAADPIGEMVEHLRIIREGGNEESVAVVAEKMEHAWDVQAPKLFAELVVSWIESKPNPEGVVGSEEWNLRMRI